MINSKNIDSLFSGHSDLPALTVGETVYTRADLANLAWHNARKLRRLGLGEGDVLALWLPNGVEWIGMFLGAALLNVLVIPVSTRYKSFELLHLLSTSKASAIAVSPTFLNIDFLGMVEEIRPRLPQDLHVIDVEADTSWRVPDSAAAPFYTGSDSAPCCAFSTSGTTGNPKLAVHDLASVATHAVAAGKAFGMQPGDVYLCSLPLYGIIGFTSTIAALASGAQVVLHALFQPALAAEAIQGKRVTHFFGSDDMYAAILTAGDFDLSSLRRGAVTNFAGRATDMSVVFENRFGTRIAGAYGSSECFALTTTWSPTLPADARGNGGGDPVHPEIELRVVDLQTGAPMSDGQAGELQIRGYNVLSHYLNNEEATRRAFTVDGWFTTGDLCRLDRGTLTYFSRIADSLRLRGYLVDPGEIEEFLSAHEAIELAAVVGVNQPGVGDIAVAFASLKPGCHAEEPDLLAFCRAGIANYKVPSRIVIVESFPEVLGANGRKIQKGALRTIAQDTLRKSEEGSHAHSS
ncbi:AMP-binding protein [Allomesorhizobium camelthorni]|uniref:AMP-binding protein n=1 Tax=Allomesorhizobium camelthorni TaxID=475069 RepID=A0A6G4WF94_9HYPH|nr:AMP-binding protein [Mesorhizobium camelthorni]NGO53462.1 AMP-binding protein [Mesorhizobium camelthorni]